MDTFEQPIPSVNIVNSSSFSSVAHSDVGGIAPPIDSDVNIVNIVVDSSDKGIPTLISSDVHNFDPSKFNEFFLRDDPTATRVALKSKTRQYTEQELLLSEEFPDDCTLDEGVFWDTVQNILAGYDDATFNRMYGQMKAMNAARAKQHGEHWMVAGGFRRDMLKTAAEQHKVRSQRGKVREPTVAKASLTVPNSIVHWWAGLSDAPEVTPSRDTVLGMAVSCSQIPEASSLLPMVVPQEAVKEHKDVDEGVEDLLLGDLDDARVRATQMLEEDSDYDPLLAQYRSQLVGFFPFPQNVSNGWLVERTAIQDYKNEDKLPGNRVITSRKIENKGDKGTAPGAVKSKRVIPMEVRARRFAASLDGDGGRLRRFIEASHLQPAWAAAVARQYRKLFMVPGGSAVKHKTKGWDKRGLGLSNCSDDVAVQVKTALIDTINIHASGLFKDSPAAEEDAREYDELEDAGEMDEQPVRVKEVRRVCSAMAQNEYLATACMRSKTCIYCVIGARLREEEHRDVFEKLLREKYGGTTIPRLEAVTLLRSYITSENVSGYLRVAAKAHNRFMHALNGNISYDAEGEHDRIKLMVHMVRRMWDLPEIIERVSVRPEAALQVLDSAMGVVTLTNDLNMSFRVYSAQGTAHSIVFDPNRLRAAQRYLNNIRAMLEARRAAEEAAQAAAAEQAAEQAARQEENDAEQEEAGGDPEDGEDAQEEVAANVVLPAVEEANAAQPNNGGNGGNGQEAGALRGRPRREAAQNGDDEVDVAARLYTNMCHQYLILQAAGIAGVYPELWIGVGPSESVEHGDLLLTPRAEKVREELVEPEQRGVLINDRTSYNIAHFVAGAPRLQGCVIANVRSEKADWRALGLKVALYDDQRSIVAAQPTGVDYAIATKAMPETFRTLREEEGLWQFQAIFVSPTYVESAIRNRGRLEVNTAEGFWELQGEDVAVIGWTADTAVPIARALWVVPHLTYPLSATFDVYTIKTIGEADPVAQVFERNSSTVTMSDNKKKIIFVTNTDSNQQVEYGEFHYAVCEGVRYGQRPAPAEVHDANPLIKCMVMDMLNHPVPLREEFDREFCNIFNGGGNWLEVDNLVGLLTVRYAPRIEGCVRNNNEGRKEKVYRGAPRAVLQHLRLPVDGRAPRSASYDRDRCVSAMDHVFTSREIAEEHPAMRIGVWPNTAELAVTQGLATYSVYNNESKTQIGLRRQNNLLDRVCRFAYLRRAFEELKRSMAIDDGICHPMGDGADGTCIPMWNEWIRGTDHIIGTTEFAHGAIGGGRTQFFWDMNLRHNIEPTATGVRTHCDMWKSDRNKALQTTDITLDGYMQVANPDDWRYMAWHQQAGKIEDRPILEQHMMRLDADYAALGLSHARWPEGGEEVGAVSWLMQSTAFGVDAFGLGWNCSMAIPNNIARNWGWGLVSRKKLWATRKYVTLGLGAADVQRLSATTIGAGIWLATDISQLSLPTTAKDYMLRSEGVPRGALNFHSQAPQGTGDLTSPPGSGILKPGDGEGKERQESQSGTTEASAGVSSLLSKEAEVREEDTVRGMGP